jgi:hypothetical protein
LLHTVELINASSTGERDAAISQFFFVSKIMQEISRQWEETIDPSLDAKDQFGCVLSLDHSKGRSIRLMAANTAM